MAYIKIDDTGRITAASETHHCGVGEIQTEIPVEVWEKGIHNFTYENGEFVYAPIPEHSAFPTAPRNITEGEYITVDGVMYKAITNIPNGASIITGQNAIETTVEAQLYELQKGE